MADNHQNEIPTIRLRGHHLLCVFGFRGYGYDENFVTEMSRVVRQLCQPETRIEIVAGPDDLCAHCPNRQRERCASPENKRDAAVLAASGLTRGETASAEMVFATVMNKIRPAQLDELCTGCSWSSLGYCRQGLAEKQLAYGWQELTAVS
ncbi:MAG TPA: DUF1284 domain-containing protein [Armatimonadota bacterium]|nr:DUF1284 domain-containing protein [Armatimonadota bacterium]